MKLWAPEGGDGGGGGDAAATTTTSAETKAAESVLGGDVAKTETKAAGGEAKAAATETKAAAPETKDAKAETKPDAKVPALVDEKWEPKAVEGVTRDPKVVGDARTLFSKLKLSAEQAQALVEFSDAQAKASAEQVTAADTEWVKELKADKELGGAKFEATRESVRSLLRQLKSGPELAKWVDKMGIGNATPLVRVLAELASRTSEDTVKDTVVDPAAAAVNEHERRIARTYGNNHKES
jgi:hypothetical protein